MRSNVYIGDDAVEFIRTEGGERMLVALQNYMRMCQDNLIKNSGSAPLDEIRRQAGIIVGIGQVIDMLRTQTR